MTDPLLGKQWQIRQGDVREVLAGMDDQSVQCVVTSPPYWGLRDYGLPPLLWGGSDECEHDWGQEIVTDTRGTQIGKAVTVDAREVARGQFCRLCGCWRGSLGLEPDPAMYISHLVEIFREVRRVLRDDGSMWCNIAGCYYSQGPRKHGDWAASGTCPQEGVHAGNLAPSDIFKPKDWVPIPWMLGMALQADGWWLRSPIIWAKGLSFCETYSGSVMPESVRDRPTTSYEYVLLLTKNKSYFYDQDAVREPHQDASLKRYEYGLHRTTDGTGLNKGIGQGFQTNRMGDYMNLAGRNLRSVWAIGVLDHFKQYCFSQGVDVGALAAGYLDGQLELKDTWTINPYPFPDAHFATFPPALVSPCIKAGTSERGCCPECGKPWERVVEREPIAGIQRIGDKPNTGHGTLRMNPSSTLGSIAPHGQRTPKITTLGWRPGCSHGHDPTPCLVLDCFSGAGTTVMVALRLGRRAIGIELSEAYVKMSRKRIIDDCPMLNIPGEALTR